MIEFDFNIRVGRFDLHASGCQGKPRMGLFGPSGCGKTTLLNCLAGLLRPNKGCIKLDGVTLFDTRQKIDVPTYKRSIGYVFQDGRLFPHMSVKSNLEYGRQADTSGFDMTELVKVFGLKHILDRSPETLSGGEYQRVALARTLAASPRLLLLDEPLVSVDISSKRIILYYLEKAYRQWRIPYIYVSHYLSEILFLTDETWEMSQGVILQSARPEILLSRASNDMEPILNIIEGTVVEIPENKGYAVVSSNDCKLMVPKKGIQVNDKVSLAIPSGDLIISTDIPHGISARNVLPATIRSMEQNGYALWIVTESGSNRFIVELTEDAGRELKLRQGKSIFLVFKSYSVNVTLMKQESGNG